MKKLTFIVTMSLVCAIHSMENITDEVKKLSIQMSVTAKAKKMYDTIVAQLKAKESAGLISQVSIDHFILRPKQFNVIKKFSVEVTNYFNADDFFIEFFIPNHDSLTVKGMHKKHTPLSFDFSSTELTVLGSIDSLDYAWSWSTTYDLDILS